MSDFDKSFWNSSDNSILTSQASEGIDESLQTAISDLELKGRIMISTSGTTSSPRLAVISKRAMLLSAKSVNEHLNICAKDKWLCCLPTTHVSGLSMHARSVSIGSSLIEFKSKWSPKEFWEMLNEYQITLCSFVPSQLHDLIKLNLRPNEQMRALIVGGDKLRDDVRAKALDLGWPVLTTYGMTETCSQVATEVFPGDGMKPLEIWSLRISEVNGLEVKGDPLFDGYFEKVDDNWKFNAPFTDNGWFLTGDTGVLNNDRISITGRKDEQIKIFGEKINIELLRSFVAESYDHSITLIAAPDPRKGNRIVMVAENSSEAQRAFEHYNASVISIERADELLIIDKLPRTSLGKIRIGKLYEILENRSEA